MISHHNVFLCLFSGRDQAVVERENRARERDRNREVLLINVLRQHAQNRAERERIQVANVSIMARDEHRQLGRNNGDNSGTSRGSNLPVKRKCLNYGPDSVETWAATEVSINHYQLLIYSSSLQTDYKTMECFIPFSFMKRDIG